MNKKIATEIALGIILIIAIVVGGAVWMSGGEKNNEISLNINQGAQYSKSGTQENMLSKVDGEDEAVGVGAAIPAEQLVIKSSDYDVKNLKIDPKNPVVNEVVYLTFSLYNNGQSNLSSGGYSSSLEGANIVDDSRGTTCDGTRIIAPGTSCKVGKKISYSSPGKYTIAVSADDSQSVAEVDEKNNFARLDFEVEPSVELTYPNGGEIFKEGLKYVIRWKEKGKNVSKIQLAAVETNTGSVTNISKAIDASKGSFDWVPWLGQLPTGIGDGYKIRIVNLETGDIYDESDSVFQIVFDGATICHDPDGGLNYSTKGSACSGNMCLTDTCQGANTLEEANCNLSGEPSEHPGLEWIEYTCPNGCQDGVCI